MEMDNNNNNGEETSAGLVNTIQQLSWFQLNQARIILTIALLFCLMQFFIQLSAGVMVNAWMHDFHISAYLAGLLSAAYFLVYTCLQTPVGMLMDRYGPRYLLTMGAGCGGIFCVLFASTHWFSLAILARIGIGTGAAFAFVGCLALIRSWFSPSRYAMLVGMVETIGLSATIIGNILLASYINLFGWRSINVAIGGFLVIVAVFTWLFVKDKPDYQDLAGMIEQPASLSRLKKHRPPFMPILKAIIGKPQNWLNGLIYGLLFSLVTVFSGLWAIPFFVKSYHMTLTVATAASTMILVGASMGGPVIGYFFQDNAGRRQTLIAGSFISAILIAMVIYIPGIPVVGVFILLLLTGLACSVYIFTFSFAKDMAPEHGYSTIIGFTNALGVGVAPILQPLLGWIMHLACENHAVAHVQPSVGDYQVALMVLPIGLVIAGISAVRLRITDLDETVQLDEKKNLKMMSEMDIKVSHEG